LTIETYLKQNDPKKLNVIYQGGGPEKKQISLCSDNVAGERDGIAKR
jgi:hypothetical protein